MGFDPITLGMQAGSSAINAGMGLLLEGHNDRRQLRQQQKLNEQQLQFDKQKIDYQQEAAYKMWERTNYGEQVEQLKKANLSPGMMYGHSGAGGAITGSPSGSTNAPNAPAGAREIMDLQLLQTQKELMEAQARNLDADTVKKSGVDTRQGEQNIENQILQGVILKYTGKEAEAQFNMKNALRGVEMKTYEDEMSARQGLAGTIYELWQEGKLKEKSLNEIEQIALQYANLREQKSKILKEMDLLEKNTKGVDLNNMITELELKLQQQTGIDKTSATWLKILGRLFVTLFGE